MDSEAVALHQTVFVKDGTITEIGPADGYSLSGAAEVVDGGGRFLIPGLADMHVHVWSDSDLPLYVANGVTLVRNMWGESATLALRVRVAADNVLGPRIVTAGRLVDGDPPVWGEYSGVARSADEARTMMDEQQRAGFDFFKIYARLSLDTFDAIAAQFAGDRISLCRPRP